MLNLIKQNSVKFIDFRFTDLFGSWYHKTYKADSNKIELILANEIPIDGSFVANRYVYENVILLPDLITAFLDPFCAQATLVILCDIMDKDSKEHKYDSRSIAKRAYKHMLSTNIADQAYFNPEMQFYIFDSVKYHTSKCSSYLKLDLIGENNPNKKQYDEMHELKDIMTSPNDQLHDIRSEILEMMSEVGIKPLSHYLQGVSKCGVEFECEEFLRSADNIQKFKYVVRNVASSYGKTITFMPFPIKGCERSSMRCSQSLWKNNENLFFYQNISETCLYYIGGIIKHGQAISAFAKPTTNSYANLLHLGYSFADSAQATVKIPYSGKVVQVCFPDAIANPYLCFAVQLMAGLDGIKNKIHPGEALDEQSEFEKNTASQSLQSALDALSHDKEFLLQGGVFTEEQINEYIIAKKSEIKDKELAIHPVEFANYYNL
ncbi:glutamine synthetase beta-grasp domain-containing protein [Candidatus Mesenet endosymbiont of Agriotes lineatus]|uniref:glutamine synthetase beta-grasp domain-containing protein n=1 Tax=Candidatus Mesenet endosymbiont of Agriotes lineatus TaxID=3077948 RepID=UPI0030D5EB24